MKTVKTRYQSLKRLTYTEFQTKCSNPLERDKIRVNIINGDVYVILNVINQTIVSRILQIAQTEDRPASSSTKILQGIGNIYYTSNNIKSKLGEYTAIDRSWYFFPWNEDRHEVLKVLQPIFDNVILLNNKSPGVIVKNTPLDGEVQRFHMINYPPNSGEISLHIDPTGVTQVNSGIYLTEFGVDYHEGGFFVLDRYGYQVNLDREIAAGDLILFYPGLPHGVLPVKCAVDQKSSVGRFFFNMNLIQSHETPGRVTSKGLV